MAPRVLQSLLLLAMLLGPTQADALCLGNDYSLNSEYGKADHVVAARVINARLVKDPEDPEGYAGVIYTVEIFRRWRGRNIGTLDVYSENTSARFDMDPGRSYLLFLSEFQGTFFADNCGNSGAFGERGREMAALDALTRTRP